MASITKTIQNAINDAIEKARQQKDVFQHEPINWGDLSCTCVYMSEYMDSPTYIAVVEECGPESVDFGLFIEDEACHCLDLSSYNVRVITEW